MKKIFILIFIAIISLFIGNISVDNLDLQVLFYSRIPRVMAVCLAGIGLGVSGLLMQKIMHNNFVSPSIAGTIEGGKLGYIVSLLFMQTTLLSQSILVFLFSLTITLIFVLLIKILGLKNLSIPIVGMIISLIVSAFCDFLIYNFELSLNVNNWLIGSFSNIIATRYEVLYLIVFLVIILIIFNHYFDIISMGEDFSKNLGVNYNLWVIIGIVIIALISTVIILSVGLIPLIGLVVPNLVRMFYGDNMKRDVYLVSYYSMLLLLISDIVSRVVIFPYEMPISVTTSIIGSVIFIYIIFRMVKNEKI